jgi:hypothetical protein
MGELRVFTTNMSVASLMLCAWAVGLSTAFAQSQTPLGAYATGNQPVELEVVVDPFVVPLRHGALASPSDENQASPPAAANSPSKLSEERVVTQTNTTEITAQSDAGITLQELLMRLGAQVEWSRESVGEVIVRGNLAGSPEAVARMALTGINHVIIRDHGRLRIIVMGFERSATNLLTAAAPAQPEGVKEPQKVTEPREVKQLIKEPSKWTGNRHQKTSRRLPPADSL